MENEFPDGMWPVMLTPFTSGGTVDYRVLSELVEWYISSGSSGLFAVCQSSEMFFLSLEERCKITQLVKETAGKRVPVISSGHISYNLKDQVKELCAVAESGADALILISNRFAKENESDDVFLENLDTVISELPENLPLGFYECPYPYKRILSDKIIKYCVDSERFYFLKDTSCDMENIRRKLVLLKGSRMKLYNANTATLLESLKEGASGYSGVMANYHPRLYAWLLQNWKKEPERAEILQGILTMCSFIELKNYPLSAKYYLRELGVPIEYTTRKNTKDCINQTEILELRQLRYLSEELLKKWYT